MDEEEKVKQEALKYMEQHSTLLRKWRDENLAMRDEFAAENTYKFSNLIISLSVGIIGGMSFLLSNINNIDPVSKIFSLSLVLPIISIILEIIYRRKVVDVNREACDRRANFISDFMKNEAARRFKNQPKTFQDLIGVVSELDEIEKNGFSQIISWIKKQEPGFELMRKFSLGLLGITLVSVIVIIFIETGIFTQ